MKPNMKLNVKIGDIIVSNSTWNWYRVIGEDDMHWICIGDGGRTYLYKAAVTAKTFHKEI